MTEKQKLYAIKEAKEAQIIAESEFKLFQAD